MEPYSPLTIDAHPAPGDLEFLDDQINRYNIATTGIRPADDILLSILVRDQAGAIVAGIWGWTWGGCCEIRTLWVYEQLRGQGLGQRLLAAAEQEALRRGCRQMLLDTHSFQAPGFYQRFGFEIVGTIEDYPVGHCKYYLRKRLDARLISPSISDMI
jgi:ribosomal protein S18 acetylase RimI-like enzyme